MPTPSTTRSRRTPARRLAVASLATTMIAAAIPSPASAGPIAESFRQWSQRRQTQTRVEKPFSHQTATVDLGVHPSAWSRVKSSGMAGVAKVASSGGRPSVLGKLRSRLTGRGGEDKSAVQQATTPLHQEN